MHYSAWLLAIVATLASAQDFSSDDYPSQCSSVCTPVASRASYCDDQFDDDSAELNCLCTGPDMNNAITQCNACVEPYRNQPDTNNDDDDDDDNDGDDYNDILELSLYCNAQPGNTTNTITSAIPSTTVYSTTITSTDDDGDVETEVEQITSTIGIVPIVTTGTTTTTGSDGDETQTFTSTISTSTRQAGGSNPTDASSNGNTSSGSAAGSGNGAIATAAPALGAGALAIIAAAAAL